LAALNLLLSSIAPSSNNHDL
ncbi:hypothetical protein THAOC_03921, partial [Thalassiosira oceanica]